MSLAKRAARRLLGPMYDPLQRRWSAYADRRRRRAYEALRDRVHEAVLARSETRVAAGPFTGMRYVSAGVEGNLLPKLVGSYELELAPIIETIAATNYEHVINVGAADGYYAVGLALRLPQATIFAIDVDPAALVAVGETARLNGVSERVRMASAMTGEMFDAARVLVVCDCEGCERDLLDPQQIPQLRRADILVELHDFIDPGISDVIQQRFEATHHIALVDTDARDGAAFPILRGLPPQEQQFAVDELRPAAMRWAWMTAAQ